MRASLLWPSAALLTFLAADVAIVSTLGAICGRDPLPPNNSSQYCDADGVGVVFFLSHVWPTLPYVFGESSLDLWIASLLRALAFVALLAVGVCQPARQ